MAVAKALCQIPFALPRVGSDCHCARSPRPAAECFKKFVDALGARRGSGAEHQGLRESMPGPPEGPPSAVSLAPTPSSLRRCNYHRRPPIERDGGR